MEGLKTGMYNLRTRPAAQAIQFNFTVEQNILKSAKARAQSVCEPSPPGPPLPSPALVPVPNAMMAGNALIPQSSTSIAPAPQATKFEAEAVLAALSLRDKPQKATPALDEKMQKIADADPEFYCGPSAPEGQLASGGLFDLFRLR